jgi:phage shock protein PspC (stress-responsive transcriptional regulator)
VLSVGPGSALILVDLIVILLGFVKSAVCIILYLELSLFIELEMME